MAREILGEYGPDSKSGGQRSDCGGVLPKDVKPLPYDPPKGPKDQNHQRPGLAGGTNHGNCGTQGRH